MFSGFKGVMDKSCDVGSYEFEHEHEQLWKSTSMTLLNFRSTTVMACDSRNSSEILRSLMSFGGLCLSA